MYRLCASCAYYSNEFQSSLFAFLHLMHDNEMHWVETGAVKCSATGGLIVRDRFALPKSMLFD